MNIQRVSSGTGYQRFNTLNDYRYCCAAAGGKILIAESSSNEDISVTGYEVNKKILLKRWNWHPRGENVSTL